MKKAETFSNLAPISEKKIQLGGFRKVYPSAKTQKAKGIVHLMREDSREKVGRYGLKVPYHYVLKAKGYKPTKDEWDYPLFVRPCPVTPRHGFVDSRLVRDLNEFQAVVDEILKEEEEAEIAVSLPLPYSMYNFILAGSALSFGPGHDGATSGVDNFSFPLAKAPLEFPQEILGSDGQIPFIEGIITKQHQKYITQVRAVPEGADINSPDFIPEDIEVLNVVKAEGDLLEWETKAKEFPPGTVVDHYGGNLASHFAVHSILNNVPIVTTFKPEVGQKLQKNSEKSEFSLEEKKLFAAHFATAMSNYPIIPQSDVGSYMDAICHLAVSMLHNSAGFLAKKPLREMAFILGSFTKVCLALSLGETRYAPEEEGVKKKYPGGSRLSVYRKEFNKKVSFEQMIADGINSKKIFTDGNLWGPHTGYGGIKWGRCTHATLCLIESCLKGDIKKALEDLNLVIHEEHNGGYYINKVFNTHHFDGYSKDPAGYTLRHLESICFGLCKLLKIEKEVGGKLTKIPEEILKRLSEENKKKPVLSAGKKNKSPLDPNNKIKLRVERIQLRTLSQTSMRLQIKLKGVQFIELNLKQGHPHAADIKASVFSDFHFTRVCGKKENSYAGTEQKYFVLERVKDSYVYKKVWGTKEIVKTFLSINSLNALLEKAGYNYKISK